MIKVFIGTTSKVCYAFFSYIDQLHFLSLCLSLTFAYFLSLALVRAVLFFALLLGEGRGPMGSVDCTALVLRGRWIVFRSNDLYDLMVAALPNRAEKVERERGHWTEIKREWMWMRTFLKKVESLNVLEPSFFLSRNVPKDHICSFDYYTFSPGNRKW